MMKRRILLIALVLSTPSPMALGGDPSPLDVRVRTSLSAVAADALDRLNARAENDFAAVPAPMDGAAVSLYGGRLAAGEDHLAAATRFAAEHGDVFGFDSVWTTRPTARGARRVDVAFERDGTPIEGVSMRLVFDDEHYVVGAAAAPARSTTVLGEFARAPAESETVARATMDDLRRQRDRSKERTFAAEVVSVYHATAAGLAPCHKVTLSSTPTGEVYSVSVDARNGGVIRVLDELRYGTGTYPFFAMGVEFETGVAEGKVFTSIKNAIKSKATTKDLKQWSKGVPSPVDLEKGFLVGAHADIWEAIDDNAFSKKGKFNFGPNGPDANFFDEANVFYQVETFYSFLEKHLGPLQIDFSLPIIVNAPNDAANANAFFSPTTFATGHTLGWLQFDDLSDFFGGVPQADFSRDPTVVDHEYIHAMLFFEGTPFQDPLDFPTRAVGEAIPDFFAATHHKVNGIGQYLESLFGEGIGRNLQDDDHFPETTLDAMVLTGDLPEEHRNGEIFGSILVDLRGVIGDVPAMQLVFAALPFMPEDMAALGYGSVTAGNAVQATADFFGTCVIGLLASNAEAADQLGEIIGCATGRGVFGQDNSTITPILNLEALEGGKEKYLSRFVAGATEHRYFFRAAENRTLKVKVIGSKSGKVKPDFLLTDDMGGTAAATHNGNKKFSDKKRIVEEKDILLNLPLTVSPANDDPFYVLTVTTPDGKEGKYKIVVSIQ